jgi:hypothetical protein
VNDKELNELVGEYYFDKHVEGKLLRKLFMKCFNLGKDYAAMLPSQRKRLIEDLQAAKDVLNQMGGGK